MRLALRWIVRMAKLGNGSEVQGETRDVSSEGFYCVAPQSFTTGESLDCAIGIPVASSPGRQRYVNCRCTVLRVERIGDELFGVACHIDAYSVASDQIQ